MILILNAYVYLLLAIVHNVVIPGYKAGPDLEGGHSGSCPPRRPASELFVYPCIAFLPIFLCLAGHKTKRKAYL